MISDLRKKPNVRFIFQITFLFLLTGLYAVTRYVFSGKVGFEHIPAFIVNKAVSFTAAISLSVTAWKYQNGAHEDVRRWGTVTLHLILIHILISVMLFSGETYPDFFSNGSLTVAGELLILSGVGAGYLTWLTSRRWVKGQRMYYVQLGSAFLIGGHLIARGGWKWFRGVDDWPLGLPPISLLAMCFTAVSIYWFLRK